MFSSEKATTPTKWCLFFGASYLCRYVSWFTGAWIRWTAIAMCRWIRSACGRRGRFRPAYDLFVAVDGFLSTLVCHRCWTVVLAICCWIGRRWRRFCRSCLRRCVLIEWTGDFAAVDISRRAHKGAGVNCERRSCIFGPLCLSIRCRRLWLWLDVRLFRFWLSVDGFAALGAWTALMRI